MARATYTLTELGRDTEGVIAAIDEGRQSVLITDHGRPVCLIIPPSLVDDEVERRFAEKGKA